MKEKSLNGLHTEAFAKMREIVMDLKFCMMATETPEGRIVARPMTCHEIDADGTLWFFASDDSDQTVVLDNDENLNLGFASPEKSRYLSISGTAEIVKDRGKIEELWTPFVKAWFPEGKDDPRLCLIRVRPITAEYWDSPSSKVVELFGIAKAIVTGATYDGGTENERIRLN